MATSKLQEYAARMLAQYFPEYNIKENFRPDWMLSCDNKRLELDLYIDELKVAIEIQGQQHYVFVEFFHGNEDGFRQRLKDDKEKEYLCQDKKVRLYKVSTEDELFDTIVSIKKKLKNNFSPIDRREYRIVDIVSNPKNTYFFKFCATTNYMYYRFLEDGIFFSEGNTTLQDFYLANKGSLDKKLNKKFRAKYSERKVKAHNKIT